MFFIEYNSIIYYNLTIRGINNKSVILSEDWYFWPGGFKFSILTLLSELPATLYQIKKCTQSVMDLEHGILELQTMFTTPKLQHQTSRPGQG